MKVFLVIAAVAVGEEAPCPLERTVATTGGNPAVTKCGLGCHTIVKTRDYVFTDYGKR